MSREGPSLLIESTNSMIIFLSGLFIFGHTFIHEFVHILPVLVADVDGAADD